VEAERNPREAMAASVEAAAAAVVAPPASVGGDEVVVGGGGGGASEQARTLIGALNLLSRNLPLPPAVLHAVSSIYHGGDAWEGEGEEGGEEEVAAAAAAVGDGCGESGEGEEDRADASPGADEGVTLIQELEDAVLKNQGPYMSYSELTALKEDRFNTSIQHRLTELEGLLIHHLFLLSDLF
jgi:hypothetical protein